MPTVTGPFDVTRTSEPPYDTAAGITLGRTHFDKRFHGPLTATSAVEMTSAMVAAVGSGAYVAIERITGTLDGRRGSFVVHHLGLMDRGQPSLTIGVVPDSGTDELVGLTGAMAIDIAPGGAHSYRFDYALADAPQAP